MDFKELADSLLVAYSKRKVTQAQECARRPLSAQLSSSKVARSINSICSSLGRYKDPESLEKALDAVNLAKIYDGVDKQEAEQAAKPEEARKFGYEDFVVIETLRYFRDDFFKWVTKPACPICNLDGGNIVPTGLLPGPTPNPQEISVVEKYRCQACDVEVQFPRINNPVLLLETRRGRCGEWVNCFMLVLSAVLGPEGRLRYVWNAEDHVWCEYYSRKLRRWIHLDPCENAFDNPSLYCENWGKKMSWVIGMGDTYVADLSDKYITREDRRVSKNSVANEHHVARFIEHVNALLLVRAWQTASRQGSETNAYMRIYEDVLLLQAKEHRYVPASTTQAAQGRQSGSAEWTQARGESGRPR